jgi:hypothetical protein
MERVLKQFKSGHNPTFTQLADLESALFAFSTEKRCGHNSFKYCECE